MSTRAYLKPRALDKVITFERLTTSQGSRGGMVSTWTNAFPGKRFWASIEAGSGSLVEQTRQGPEVAKGSFVITTWYHASVKAGTYRVVYGDEVYTIQHIDNTYTQGTKMVMHCELGVRNG